MEKEKQIELSQFEYDGSFNEAKLNQQTEQKVTPLSPKNISGTIHFAKKFTKKRRSFRWIRIRSFFTKHKKFKRLVEFSIHPGGIHMLRLAVFYSESGCGMCKFYVEKNLF